MAIILPEVHSLEQHIQQFQSDPESYRPGQCPGCGNSAVWCHGHYHRQPDIGAGAARLCCRFLARLLEPMATFNCDAIHSTM